MLILSRPKLRLAPKGPREGSSSSPPAFYRARISRPRADHPPAVAALLSSKLIARPPSAGAGADVQSEPKSHFPISSRAPRHPGRRRRPDGPAEVADELSGPANSAAKRPGESNSVRMLRRATNALSAQPRGSSISRRDHKILAASWRL